MKYLIITLIVLIAFASGRLLGVSVGNERSRLVGCLTGVMVLELQAVIQGVSEEQKMEFCTSVARSSKI